MKTHLIDEAMEQAIQKGVFPGASLLVSREGKIIWDKYYGSAQLIPIKRSLKKETFFDIASLTKPMATATLFMVAHQEKKINLKDPLKKYYPQIKESGITLTHLLNHTSGLPAWKPYFQDLITEAPGWVADEKGKEWLINQVLKEIPQATPGKETIYSDLGYILLGNILEKVFSLKLQDLFDQKVAKTFGLQNTFFNPINRHIPPVDSKEEDFAATEQCPWRQKVLCGEVMDDHAYIMGGVAGHAGLFSTARDLYCWLQELNKARLGKSRFISQNTFNLFCTIPLNRDLTSPFFTLGFDTPSLPSSSGDYFSRQSLGHLGYSGTSFWWDLQKNVIMILLTNRVHPLRDNDKIKKFRPKLHNLIWESVAESYSTSI